ncbi:LysR family transcriptional regulator [Vibrio panuliri]|uniref:LysR family transcriptional regulator n=1 Tax=Vibrio panuliri TaxID=1381081 RepID=A0ABX3F8E1_9VIBR|nr:LysR family transcriptional regulator [Vibrio panuliri]KAB1454170.1 LysR family transcriptional regulator [Vibrio panuliri]OLQ86459.1 LysR family transcriptional regulator [Vibrio panuliri]
MSVNIDYLAAFVEVYEQGSFAKAASLSSCHASTYSRKISNLEDDLGFDLFVRHSRSLEPTQQANAIYNHAKGFLIEANLFGDKVKSVVDGHSGDTIIAIDVAVSELGVVAAIAKLIKAIPSLNVTIITGDTESTRQAIIDGTADMAFALTTYSLPAEVNSFRYQSFPFTRVATQEYLCQYDYMEGKPFTPSTTRNMTQIILNPLRNLGIESQVYSHHLIKVDSQKVALELVKCGVGWCNIPEMMATAELKSGELTQFHVEDDFALNWSIELMWPTEKVFDPVREKLITIIQ